MKIHITLEKDTFEVGETCGVTMTVRTDEALKPGQTIEVQWPNSWSVVTGPSYTREFQTEDPAGAHYVGVDVKSTGASFNTEIHPRHLPFEESRSIRHGRHIVAILETGQVPAGSPINILFLNTYAPYIADEFPVWVRVAGNSPVSVPVLKTVAGPAESLRIIAPSGVRPGQAFKVLIVSLDRFDNMSASRYENKVLYSSNGRVVMRHLTFTGALRVPVSLNEPGVYRFRMDDNLSNAVRVAEDSNGPYWGDIHIHTYLSADGQGADPYPYARDVSGLDFAAATDHSSSLGKIGLEIKQKWAQKHYKPDSFVTLAGYECSFRSPSGHHNIYFRDQGRLHAEKPGLKTKYLGDITDMEKVWSSLDATTTLTIPHHTGICFSDLLEGHKGNAVDMGYGNDNGTRTVMEIYSHHGQSETYSPQHMLAYEVNRMRNPELRSNSSVPGPFYAQDYWKEGYRLGVIGSSDEHSGQGGRRHGGIAAVFPSKLTREGVFDALKERRCYATTGERILLDFSVDGVQMGQPAKRSRGSQLVVKINVYGTQTLVRVDILLYCKEVDDDFVPIFSAAPRPKALDASFDLKDTLKGPSIYYARVIQEPLVWPGMAWSSPVWIDC